MDKDFYMYFWFYYLLRAIFLSKLFNLFKSKTFTAQKMKFFIKGFFSKCDQIGSFLRIWSHLLKKPLMENFIFCAMLRTIPENKSRPCLTEKYLKIYRSAAHCKWYYIRQVFNFTWK